MLLGSLRIIPPLRQRPLFIGVSLARLLFRARLNILLINLRTWSEKGNVCCIQADTLAIRAVPMQTHGANSERVHPNPCIASKRHGSYGVEISN